jgi:hypothetical protein
MGFKGWLMLVPPQKDKHMSDEHESLLHEWANTHPADGCFIRDGIISHQRWQKAPRKVLFLLRQGWDYARGGTAGFDMREEVRQWGGAKGPTMHTVARWAYAIHHTTQNSIPRLSCISRAAAYDSLLASAVVNIKKSRGVKVSTLSDIDAYAVKDSDFIRRQIEIIAPHIVICGGTWRSVRPCQWIDNSLREVFDHVFTVDGRYYLSHSHPSYPIPLPLKYYTLCCLIQNSGCLTAP